MRVKTHEKVVIKLAEILEEEKDLTLAEKVGLLSILMHGYIAAYGDPD